MRAIVFDMDGVLFDTETISRRSWSAVAKEVGIEGIEELSMQFIGRNENDCRRLLMEHYGEEFPHQVFREKVWKWFQDYLARHGVPMKEGVRELLNYLQKEGYRIGLASSSRRETVLGNLEKTGLAGYFTVVVTGDMVEHSKPRPDIYLLACRKLGVNPQETYAVEDSPNGIRAACAAEMKTLIVPDLIQPDEELRRMSEGVFQNLTEVLNYLRV